MLRVAGNEFLKWQYGWWEIANSDDCAGVCMPIPQSPQVSCITTEGGSQRPNISARIDKHQQVQKGFLL